MIKIAKHQQMTTLNKRHVCYSLEIIPKILSLSFYVAYINKDDCECGVGFWIQDATYHIVLSFLENNY